MSAPHAPAREAARKDIHLTVSLTAEDAELLDLLRARLGQVAGEDAPLSHARVMRLALRQLAASWKIGPAWERQPASNRAGTPGA